MIIKEQNYARKGAITTFGNKNFNANEAKILNKYSNTEPGKLQDIDTYIKNIYSYFIPNSYSVITLNVIPFGLQYLIAWDHLNAFFAILNLS